MRRFLPSIFAFLVLSNTLSAQNLWSLARCVEHAQEHNLDLQRAEQNIALAELSELQSQLAFLPSVNATGGYYWNFGLTIDPITNTRQPGTRNTFSSTLQGNWSLFHGHPSPGGRVHAQVAFGVYPFYTQKPHFFCRT